MATHLYTYLPSFLRFNNTTAFVSLTWKLMQSLVHTTNYKEDLGGVVHYLSFYWFCKDAPGPHMQATHYNYKLIRGWVNFNKNLHSKTDYIKLSTNFESFWYIYMKQFYNKKKTLSKNLPKMMTKNLRLPEPLIAK